MLRTSIPKLGGNVNNRTRGQLMRSLAFRVGWEGWAGAVSFRRWLRGPMLSWVRVGWGGGGGGGAGASSLCGWLRTMEGGWGVGGVGAVSFRRWGGRGTKLMWIVAYYGGRVAL